MKIQFIVINQPGENKKTTIESIEKADLKKYGINYSINEIIASTRKEESIALNSFLEKKEKDDSYICIIPNPSTVSEYMGLFIESYILNNKDIELGKDMFLPLIELVGFDENGKEFAKGFLNTCIWKSYLQPEEVGFLDKQLANKQIDTTLHGVLIPISLFETIKINETFEYFYQFNLLNKIVETDTTIIGIPKSFVSLVYDYELKNEDQEVKKEEFKKAKSIECVKEN